MTDATSTMPSTVAVYRQALATAHADLDLTPEQAATLATAKAAFVSARDNLDTAQRSRKDKAERVASASALYDVAQKAYAAAQEAEKEAEAKRWRAVKVLIEQVGARLADEALDAPVRFVNSVPTDEQVPDYYGREMRTVWRTTVDDEPISGNVRGWEAGDIRIGGERGRDTDLSFEVALLEDEEFEKTPGVRKERFGYSASVRHNTRWREEENVEVQWGTVGARSIEDGENAIRLYTVAVRLAKLVQALVEEVKV